MTHGDNKLLVALQYHAGDRNEALDLLRLLIQLREAETEPPVFELLLFHAPDADEPGARLLSDLSAAGINCSSACSDVSVSGWPMAPNRTWVNLVNRLVDLPWVHPDCRHVLCAEPDSSPLTGDWDRRLLAEHLIGVSRQKIFSGHFCAASDGMYPHVNGNLIFDRAQLAASSILPKLLQVADMPWDVEYASLIMPRCWDSRMLHSSWRGEMRDSFMPWSLEKGDGACAWLHGFKGHHLRHSVRHRLMGEKQPISTKVTVYCGTTEAEDLIADKEMTYVSGDYMAAVSEWATTGGLLMKAPLHLDTKLIAELHDILTRLGNPSLACSRHPENIPAYRSFSEYCDTSVLYAAADSPDLAQVLEATSEPEVMERLALIPGVMWMPQGLWKPADLPYPPVARYAVLRHSASGGWKVINQSSDWHTASVAGFRNRMQGKTLLLDTKMPRATHIRRIDDLEGGAGEKPKIFTYTESVPGLPDNSSLIELWKKSWAAQGWAPVVLGRQDAMKHPLYAGLLPRFKALPTVNPPQYELACYLRWLAVAAAGGGWMSDYDVINYGFAPRPAEVGTRVWGGGGGPCPCLVSGSADDFTETARAFGEWEGAANLERGRPHTSDQNILRRRPELCIWKQDCVEYKDEGWEKAEVVHYPYGATKMSAPARAEVIPGLR